MKSESSHRSYGIQLELTFIKRKNIYKNICHNLEASEDLMIFQSSEWLGKSFHDEGNFLPLSWHSKSNSKPAKGLILYIKNKNDIINREISKNIKVWYFTIYDLVYSKRKQEQRVRLTTTDVE